MVGSIFYAGHRIVRDEMKGEFDRPKARELLAEQAEMSALTGLSCMVDVIASTTPAMINYLEFLADATDAPLLADSMSAGVRMEVLRHFAGTAITSRLVYNSIDEHATPEELEAIAGAGVKSAVVMAFSNTAVKPAAKIKLLKGRLLPAAAAAGVENVLVDTGVLDVASVGWAAAAMKEIAAAAGLPVGCAPSNSLYSWKRARGLARPAFEAASGAIFSYLMSFGANFLFYGPIGSASWVFPACAAADAVRSYAARLEGVRPSSPEHPLNRFL
jgi:tetrahydromethanopterin S-methyltransferase subunit H